jgi:isoquinoline 1-oxidoreductase
VADDLKQQYVQDSEAAECDVSQYRFTVTRRELGLLGFGLVCTVTTAVASQVASRLHIAQDGRVTLLTGKVDFGQGSRTLLTKVVAEELRVPADRVRVIMGDTDLVPDDGGTWGSLTTPQTVPVVRKAAASVRALLDRTEGGIARTSGSVSRVNGLANVTGEQKYASDFVLPAMRHGKVIRGPGYNAKLESVDPVAGLVHDGNFLGVVASTPAEAAAAAPAIKARWSVTSLPSKSEMLARFKETSIPPKEGEGGRYPALVTRGDIKHGLAQSELRHRSRYTVANIAHVPLEPRSAIAEWKGDRLTVWTGTQAPFLVRRELAGAFRIPESNVRVISFDIGGAFGGKQRGECEIEAARLAKDTGGPVKLAWTRQEEFTCSYCRPAGVVEIDSGLNERGHIQAWHHRNYNSGAPSLPPPYAIPHLSCEFHRSQSPIRQGSYRSLAAVANNFARESHVNELAAMTNADPLEFRLRNLEDSRLRDALERAAERFGWGKRKGAAQGLACNLEKDARLALFLEMDESARRLKVRRMVFAYDAGAILHPDGLRAQAQGGLIQGIGGALFEELHFDARGIMNARLGDYRVPRFSDVPEIEVILIDRPEIPSAGAGEAPITVVAPAIALALRGRVSGNLRSLPLGNNT